MSNAAYTSLEGKIDHLVPTFPDSEYPKVTIVVPTFNSAQRIGITLESLIHQEYPDFEIIVIDGGSEDRTVELVKGCRNPHIRLYSIRGFKRYEMINKGIALARGRYLNVLFPGDYYIQRDTLRIMMGFALKEKEVNLIYCGCLLREADKEVKILYRPLNLQLLKKGQQPTSLQSMWIKMGVFKEIGKFNTEYTLRGSYEFLCRFLINGHLNFFGINRVLTDYDLRGVTRQMMMCHFFETLKTIARYFGLAATAVWLFRQRDLKRYFSHLWKNIRIAFKGD